MTPSPSAPALRAAKALFQIDNLKVREERARTIDEATGLPELIESVQFVLKYDGKKLGSIGEKSLRNALSRVERVEK